MSTGARLLTTGTVDHAGLMETWDPAIYGERIADVYDEQIRRDPGSAVAFLASLAEGGRVLDLGIGTGWLALPLTSLGIEVHGVDVSEAMVKRLREKPHGEDIPVTIGDFADVPVEGEFDVIVAVGNSFFALVTQADQVRCFANAAAHLSGRGVFVTDAFVPDSDLLPRRQWLATHDVGADGVELIAGRHDRISQRIRFTHIQLSGRGSDLYPIEMRYAWPSELDLMAQLAGLRLRERVGGWDREPFTNDSRAHVSVYEWG